MYATAILYADAVRVEPHESHDAAFDRYQELASARGPAGALAVLVLADGICHANAYPNKLPGSPTAAAVLSYDPATAVWSGTHYKDDAGALDALNGIEAVGRHAIVWEHGGCAERLICATSEEAELAALSGTSPDDIDISDALAAASGAPEVEPSTPSSETATSAAEAKAAKKRGGA